MVSLDAAKRVVQIDTWIDGFNWQNEESKARKLFIRAVSLS